MKLRNPKPDDQDRIEEAFELLKQLIIVNPQIETSLWPCAFMSIIADRYIATGNTHDQFCAEMHLMAIYYKSWWENEETDSSKVEKSLTEKGFALVNEMIGKNPQIDVSMWASIFFTIIIQLSISSGCTYHDTLRNMQTSCELIKQYWEDDN